MVKPELQRELTISRRGHLFVGQFQAMAGPCEILIDCDRETDAKRISQMAAHEAWRIEQKYSRYRDDGILAKINDSGQQPVSVDEETAALLDFAYQCYQLSDGLFDLSSGILRKVWPFKGQTALPDQGHIEQVLGLIGLDKVSWQTPVIQLPQGMQLDFGGIGKEYAVDRALALINAQYQHPVLVNFGGDIATNKPPNGQAAWRVEIEQIQQTATPVFVELKQGGLATSGDSRRFVLIDGQRYGHILNPKTGWPVNNAPASVTVASASCLQAGIFSTLAMLNGPDAEAFLQQQEVSYHLIW